MKALANAMEGLVGAEMSGRGRGVEGAKDGVAESSGDYNEHEFAIFGVKLLEDDKAVVHDGDGVGAQVRMEGGVDGGETLGLPSRFKGITESGHDNRGVRIVSIGLGPFGGGGRGFGRRDEAVNGVGGRCGGVGGARECTVEKYLLSKCQAEAKGKTRRQE